MKAEAGTHSQLEISCMLWSDRDECVILAPVCQVVSDK